MIEQMINVLAERQNETYLQVGQGSSLAEVISNPKGLPYDYENEDWRVASLPSEKE